MWGEDLHDAIVNYSVEVLDVSITQEFESTPESIVSGVKGRV